MCDCKNLVEQRLADHFAKQDDGAEDVKASISSYKTSINIKSSEVSYKMSSDVVVTYNKVVKGIKKPKKIKTFISFNFCPFCGKKFEVENGK